MKNILVTPEELKEIVRESVTEALKRFQPSASKRKAKKLLTRKEVAELLHISLVTLHEWCNKGILKPHRINSRVYFYEEEIMGALMGPPECDSGEPKGKNRYNRNNRRKMK